MAREYLDTLADQVTPNLTSSWLPIAKAEASIEPALC
jgi:hypothetical protein